MWLDNRNIATVFVDLNVTIFCCFFYSCLRHSNLADEMFYEQNDIEPVPVGCQEIAPSGIHLMHLSMLSP
jgi:hypothetical protein